MEKFNAYRYTSMLGNIKTHARNVIGNAIFILPQEIKNTIGTALESPLYKAGKIDTGDRTKSLITTKANRAFAKNDFSKMKKILRGQSTKYSDAARPQESVVFDTVLGQ